MMIHLSNFLMATTMDKDEAKKARSVGLCHDHSKGMDIRGNHVSLRMKILARRKVGGRRSKFKKKYDNC